MVEFDEAAFLRDGQKTYGCRQRIEEVADEVTKKGYNKIVLTGIGGTTFEMMSVEDIIRRYSHVPVVNLNAAEGMIDKPSYINERTLVVTGSKSGDTKETVEICRWCKEQGATVVVFTGKADCPLAEMASELILCDAPGMENTYLKFYLFALCLLHRRGDFPSYPKFAEQMAVLHKNIVLWKKQFEDKAHEISVKYAKEPYQIWVGSGILWGEINMFTMCILEEMQWMRTRAVTSSMFFHGTLELVDKDVLVYLVKGEDQYRPLDERAEAFLKKYTDKLVVIDTADYKLDGIDDEFRLILSPIIFNSITRGRLAYHFEKQTGHDLEFRRYYRQFAY